MLKDNTFGIHIVTPQGKYNNGIARMFADILKDFKSCEGYSPDAPAIEITMQCGHVLIIPHLDDFPKKDVPCSCGSSDHWFVKYEIHRLGDAEPVLLLS